MPAMKSLFLVHTEDGRELFYDPHCALDAKTKQGLMEYCAAIETHGSTISSVTEIRYASRIRLAFRGKTYDKLLAAAKNGENAS